MKEFTREIRRFMWQGGKSDSSKKFHLVNWDTMCKPKIFGGARIRDPSKMNLSLGAKILWRIVSGKGAWWKDIIRKNIEQVTEKYV